MTVKICTTCHHVADDKNTNTRQLARELILLVADLAALGGGLVLAAGLLGGQPPAAVIGVVLVLPSLVLRILTNGRAKRCQACGNRTLIPTDTPKGAQLLRQHDPAAAPRLPGPDVP